MDASQDVWDWEVLPDHRSFSTSHGSKNLDDQETKEHDLLPPSGASGDVDVHEHEPADECKDIGVVSDETKPVPSVVADLMMASDDDGGEEEKKVFQSPPDAKESAATDTEDGKFAQVEEEDMKKDDKFAQEGEEDVEKEDSDDDDKARPPQCVVFSVGKLKVNGVVGALCSFGVAAATVCIFLIGGRVQHHHHRQQEQQEKIQLQFYGDDKRIQQVVQQTSRLNQAMSSVMGAGGGASTRANISFGGFYDGF